jgi:NADP-dependent 3-hydroxy acid dehydrogenase YdfG
MLTVLSTQGSRIGRETAVAFAATEATHIVLVGRTKTTLGETESFIAKLGKNTTVLIVVADVEDETDVKNLAGAIQSWNVLVHNAGYMNTPSLITQADIEDYWKAYQVSSCMRVS